MAPFSIEGASSKCGAVQRLRTLVNGFETGNDLKAYLVEFSFNGARIHLKTFKELPNAN